MSAYRFGMGFHGEQGGEMFHSTIAKIEHRARGMRRERTKIAFTMETSILQTTQKLTKNKIVISQALTLMLTDLLN